MDRTKERGGCHRREFFPLLPQCHEIKSKAHTIAIGAAASARDRMPFATGYAGLNSNRPKFFRDSVYRGRIINGFVEAARVMLSQARLGRASGQELPILEDTASRYFHRLSDNLQRDWLLAADLRIAAPAPANILSIVREHVPFITAMASAVLEKKIATIWPKLNS